MPNHHDPRNPEQRDPARTDAAIETTHAHRCCDVLAAPHVSRIGGAMDSHDRAGEVDRAGHAGTAGIPPTLIGDSPVRTLA